MSKSILYDKAYHFAIRIVETYSDLISEQKEYILGRQLLRSGTSIGAQISESEYAQSKADFIHKLYIAQKEANKTKYWLVLLRDTGYISEHTYVELAVNMCISEILKILTG
jgi:four helix bundle protein